MQGSLELGEITLTNEISLTEPMNDGKTTLLGAILQRKDQEINEREEPTRKKSINPPKHDAEIDNNDMDIAGKECLNGREIKKYSDFQKGFLYKLDKKTIAYIFFFKKTSEVFKEAMIQSPEQKYDISDFKSYVKKIQEKTTKYIHRPFQVFVPFDWNNKEKRSEVRAVAISPDLNFLVVGLKDGNLVVFDVNSEKRTERKKFDKVTAIMAVVFSPCGSKVLASTGSGDLLIVNFHNDGVFSEHTVLNPTKTSIRVACFLWDSTSLICGSDDEKLLICENYEEDRNFLELLNHEEGVCAFSYSPINKRFASGGNDSLINIFSLSDEVRKREVKDLITIKKHTGIVRALAFSLTGHLLLSGSYDKTARLYNTENGDELMIFNGNTDWVLSVALSPDNSLVLTGGSDNFTRVYNCSTGGIEFEFEDKIEGKDEGFAVRSVQFYGTKTRIISAGDSGHIKMYSIDTQMRLRQCSRHNTTIFSVDISPDKKTIVTGSDDFTVRLYDFSTGFELKRFKESSDSIYCVRFSPDGRMVIAGGNEKVLRLYDIFTGTVVCSFQDHREYITSIVFSPDGKEFASGSMDKTISIYNFIYKSFALKLPINKEKRDLRVYCFCYWKDPNWMVIGGADDSSESLPFVAMYSKLGHKKIIKLPEKIENIQVKEPNNIVCLENGDFLASNSNMIFAWRVGNPEDINEENSGFAYKVIANVTITYLTTYNSSILTVQHNKIEKEKVKSASLTVKSWKLESKNIENILEIEESEKIFETGNEKYIGDREGFKFFDKGKKKLFLYASEVGIPKVFNFSSKREERFSELSAEVKELDYYRSGSRIVVLTKDNNVRVINTYSGEIIMEPRLNRNYQIESLRFTNKKNYFIIGGSDGKVRIYNLTESDKSKSLTNTFAFENAPVEKRIILLEYSLDELPVIYCADEKGIISIIHVDEEMKHEPTPAINPIEGLKTLLLVPHRLLDSDKTTHVIVCYSDGSLRKFQNTKGNQDHEVMLSRSKEELCTARASSDFSKLITGSEDKIVRIYDLYTCGEWIFRGHQEKICAVDLFHDGLHGISASSDRVIKLFEIESGNEIFNFTADVDILKLRSSPRLDTVVVGTKNGILIFDQLLNHIQKLKTTCELISEKNNTKIDSVKNLSQDCFNMFPMSPGISFVSQLLAMSADSNDDIEILRDTVDFLDSSDDEVKKTLLLRCIFQKDKVLNISPWDVWIRIADEFPEKIQMIYYNLAKLLISPNAVGIEYISDKSSFIKRISKLYPSLLQKVLDSFLQSREDITIKSHQDSNRKILHYYFCRLLKIIDVKNFMNMPVNLVKLPLVLPCKSHLPSPRSLESLYETECKDYERIITKQSSDGVQYFNSSIRVSKIALDEILTFSDTDTNDFSLKMFQDFQPFESVYNSELLKIVVDYLWNLDSCVGIFFYRRLFIYLVFQLVVCLNCLLFIPERQMSLPRDDGEFYKSGSFILDIMIISFLGVLLLSKLYSHIIKQIRAGSLFATYNWDFWRFLDIVIIVTGISGSVLDILWNLNNYCDNTTFAIVTKCVVASFFALNWVKLMQFARGIQRTSTLMRVLVQVTNSMITYLLIILFLIAGISFTMFQLQNSYEENSPWKFLKMVYCILIGDSGGFRDLDTALNRDLYFIVLFFTTVYLVIIMLNLLIAIISDSFNKVVSMEKQNQVYEKLQFIIERFYKLNSDERRKLIKELKGAYLFEIKTSLEVNADEEKQDATNQKIERLEKILLLNIQKQNQIIEMFQKSSGK